MHFHKNSQMQANSVEFCANGYIYDISYGFHSAKKTMGYQYIGLATVKIGIFESTCGCFLSARLLHVLAVSGMDIQVALEAAFALNDGDISSLSGELNDSQGSNGLLTSDMDGEADGTAESSDDPYLKDLSDGDGKLDKGVGRSTVRGQGHGQGRVHASLGHAGVGRAGVGHAAVGRAGVEHAGFGHACVRCTGQGQGGQRRARSLGGGAGWLTWDSADEALYEPPFQPE